MVDRMVGCWRFAGVVLIIVLFCMPSALLASDDPQGVLGGWLTKDDKSVVEVYECDGAYCLKIVWLKEPNEADGTAKVDKNNPDPARQSDPIIGLTIGSGFAYKGNNIWKDGKIYDPDNGKTYSCKMELDGDTLKVRGFIGISLLGRTEVWRRKL